MAADVELRFRKFVEDGVELLFIGEEGLPLLLQAVISDFRVYFLTKMRDAFALSFKDYIGHIHKMNTII
jgi:hypothetical protein